MNAKAKLICRKFNSFYTQWTIGFFVTLIVVHFLAIIFAATTIWSFYDTSSQATQFYMLILGIMNMGLLSYGVSNGISRKDYFVGVSASAVLYSLLLSAVTLITTFLFEDMLFPQLGLDTGGSISITFTLFLSLLLRFLLYYFLGWLIMAAFHRYHWIFGAVFIGIAIVVVAFHDYLLGENESTVLNFLPVVDLTPFISLPLIAVLVLGTMTFVRKMTKDVHVKV
ncbi:hypothetical protein MKX54_04670 [Alkalihalobacillus sp. FSL R5-0424]